ncbi:hypothetical protein SPLC1_S390050 [Arthrospira platensis C1]|nr:hypothetical protein SPLC1_S390050 [Arthrospira platensis C1]
MNNQSPFIIEIANLPLPIEINPVDSLKLLHNPAKGRFSGGLLALVAHRLLLSI